MRKRFSWAMYAEAERKLVDLATVAAQVVKDCEKSTDPKAVAASVSLQKALDNDYPTSSEVTK